MSKKTLAWLLQIFAMLIAPGFILIALLVLWQDPKDWFSWCITLLVAWLIWKEKLFSPWKKGERKKFFRRMRIE